MLLGAGGRGADEGNNGGTDWGGSGGEGKRRETNKARRRIGPKVEDEGV